MDIEHGDVLGNRAAGPGIEFWGGSFLADPFGRIIAKAGHDAEEILMGEIDRELIEETRRNWPFLRDRRVDAYAPITQRFLDPCAPTHERAQITMPFKRRKYAAPTGLPHARRVGAARGHMACVAAQS